MWVDAGLTSVSLEGVGSKYGGVAVTGFSQENVLSSKWARDADITRMIK